MIQDWNIEFCIDQLWKYDPILADVNQNILVNHSELKVVSFDCFDTLVLRLVDKPTEVFQEVGRRLSKLGAFATRQYTPQEFEILRRAAEVQAREKTDKEDTTLEQIYEQLRPILKASFVKQAQEIELQAEIDLCYINPLVYEFAKYLKAQGIKLIILSDVYLSSTHIHQILEQNGVDPSLFELVLTSGDVGVCKYSSKLYEKALELLRISPTQIIHIGDNLESDYLAPRRIGIKAFHYSWQEDIWSEVLLREAFLKAGRGNILSLNSLRQVALRVFQGKLVPNKVAHFGAFVLGPVLSPFITWALSQFRNEGIKLVGAFMREGELLGEMLRREAKFQQQEIEIVPLYANRISTELASFATLEANRLIDWLRRRQTLTVKEILNQFGIPYNTINAAAVGLSADERLDNEEKIINFAKFLFQPHIATSITDKACAQRKDIIDYIRGLTDGEEKIGVLDIGYNGTAQYQLQRICQMENQSLRFVGCYLATSPEAASKVLKGVDIRGFLGSFGNPTRDLAAFLRSPAIMEIFVNSLTGTTIGYNRRPDGKVEPVLAEVNFSERTIEAVNACKKGILLFQTLWLWLRSHKPAMLDPTNEFGQLLIEQLPSAISIILSRLCAFPIDAELEIASLRELDDKYFDEGIVQLLDERFRQQVQTKGYVSLLSNPRVLWPQAVFHSVYKDTGNNFFSVGAALLDCSLYKDHIGKDNFLTVIILHEPAIEHVVEFLKRLSAVNKGQRIFCLVSEKLLKSIKLLKQSSFQNVVFKALVKKDCKPFAYLDELITKAHTKYVCFVISLTKQSHKYASLLINSLNTQMPDMTVFTEAGIICLKGKLWQKLFPILEAPSLNSALLAGIWFLKQSSFPTKEHWSPEYDPNWNWLSNYMTDKEVSWFKHFKDGLERKSSSYRLTNSTAVIEGSKCLPVIIWEGDFESSGSFSLVNQQLTKSLATILGDRLKCRQYKGNVPVELDSIVIRHMWPADWRRPECKKFIIIQPWEFGALPIDWVSKADRIDQFWVPSMYVKDVFISSGILPEKVRLVPNGIDPKLFHPNVEPLKLPTQKRFKFLFVGGTIFRKGIDVLLEAYVRAFRASDDVCLVIKDVGSKSWYKGQTLGESIKRLQASTNMPQIIYLDDELSMNEMASLYRACDCLVHPYRGEGFGLPILEAMACGRPVIVTKGGAADDFTSEDCCWYIGAQVRKMGKKIGNIDLVSEGWLLEPDKKQLIKIMQEVVRDPNQLVQKGENASKKAHNYWTWDHAAKKVIEYVMEISQRNSSTQDQLRLTSALSSMSPSETIDVTKIGSIQKASILKSNRNFPEAWAQAIEAINMRPFNPEAYLLLGEIAKELGIIQVAYKLVRLVKQMAPGWQKVRDLARSLPPPTSVPLPEWMKLPLVPQTPRLTVGMIVKNEAQLIRKAIESVRQVAWQIVIVDTGSTDETPAIAKELGAELYFFNWCDDFSAARNEVLKHCRGDWILMLDADEELAPESLEQLRKELLDPSVILYKLPIYEAGQLNQGYNYIPRLFRNIPGLCYLGRIHEQIAPSILHKSKEWGLNLAFSKTAIIHSGYNKERVIQKDKVNRNIRLLRLAASETPTDPNILMNLALELTKAGQLEEAFIWYEKAFQISLSKWEGISPELREALLTQFTSYLIQTGRYKRVIEVLQSSLDQAHNLFTASLHFNMGLALFKLGLYDQALVHFQQTIEKRERHSLTPTIQVVLTSAPEKWLAESLIAMGKTQKAYQFLLETLKKYPQDTGLLLLIARLEAKIGQPLKALHTLYQIISIDPYILEAWNLGAEISLQYPEYIEFAKDWTGEALKYFPEQKSLLKQRALALFFNGEVKEAFDLIKHQPYSEDHILTALYVFCSLCLDEQFIQGRLHIVPSAEIEFIKLYRFLIACPGSNIVYNINKKLDRLANIFPKAASLLTTALAEADS